MSKNILIKLVPVLLAGLILTGCGSPAPMLKPTPDAFNFAPSAADLGKEAKQNLKVEVFGDGIKNTKKFVIGAFQVRVRSDLTGEHDQKLKANNFLGEGNEALFQKATDNLYAEFVTNLKQRGIEVVNLSTLKKYPEYKQSGSNTSSVGRHDLKGEFPSGHGATLNATTVGSDETEDGGAGGGDNSLGRITTNWFGSSDSNYKIFYPAATPGLNYVRNIVTLFTPTDFPVGDDIVTKTELPKALLDAAANDKLGVITVAFEVELLKFRREKDEYNIGNDTRTVWRMSNAPMLRTRLTALKMLPPGTEQGSFFNANNFTQGLRITTKHRGNLSTSGLGYKIVNMFKSPPYGRHWVEIDDGSVTLTQKDEFSPGIVNPVSAKFPAAFKKATDGNLQMIMHVIDHQSDF
ncbi:MAG: hypothetical protein FD173_1283 [Gallionellaceae bacterium]|nr:MAG: hypothetical protein FD173_1283 [Gallionellaceae bacterium]